MNSITPGGGAARVTSTPEASTVRGTTSGPPSPLSETSCQEVSPGAGTGASVSARKAPEPGLVTTMPSEASCETARETVTGLTLKRSTSARLDGNFSPGE